MAAPEVDTVYFSTLVGEGRARLLLERAGLCAPGAVPPLRIGMVDFWRCCAQNIQLTDDESHGLAAQPVPRGSLSVLFTAAKEADDLGGALRRLVEAARLVRKECHLSLSRGRDMLRLTVTAEPEGEVRAEIYAECFAIVTHCALRWLAGRRLDPLRVRGAAALKTMGGELLNALHAPIARAGTGVSIDYALSDMALPVLAGKYTAWGDVEFASFVAMLGEEEPGAEPAGDEGVEHARLIAQFERGCFAESAVAAALGMSTASLRRRLSAGGHSFRALSAGYRADRLRDMLTTGMPLIDIAERLGLSDERSLRRFCAMHLGAPPAAYRKRAG